MALTLVALPVEAKIIKAGDDAAEIAAGQWLQIRFGDENDPTVMLEVQCPAGKKWTAHAYVSIEETDV